VQLRRNFSPQRRDLDAAAASPRGEAAKSVQLRRLFWSQRRDLDAAVASPRGEAAKSVQLRRFFWPQRLGRLASAASPRGEAPAAMVETCLYSSDASVTQLQYFMSRLAGQ